MPFATRESDPIRNLVRPIADLSLNLYKPSRISPPSYDPMSPSYDPAAASPCNPFPTTSPFANVMFHRSSLSSKLSSSSLQPSMQQVPTTTASVLSRIPPPHSAPSLRRTKPCRFYLDSAGCKSGRWCNFKHPVGARPDETPVSFGEDSLDTLGDGIIRSQGKQNDELWDGVPDVRDVQEDWGRASDGEVHPKYRTQPCRNFLLGLCKYGDKCQFIHPPGLFPPSTAPAALPVATIDVPLPVPVSVWGSHPLVPTPVPVASPPSPNQTNLFYRTRPCKFFDNMGSCPHDDHCKFIHDPKKAAPLSSTSTWSSAVATPSTAWADDDREIDFSETPSFGSLSSTSPMEVDSQSSSNGYSRSTSPSKPSHSSSRSQRGGAVKEVAGFHKPTWRVLGGGVMLASPEKVKKPMENFVFEHDDEEEVEILTYQPFSSDRSSSSAVATPSPPASHLNSPNHFIGTQGISSTGTADLSQYSFVTPTRFDLLRPPSPDFPLDVTMGSPIPWSASSDGGVFGDKGKKKTVFTGAELMQGITSGYQAPPTPSLAHNRVRPCRPTRSRPQLTISVPPVSQSHTVRHSPYPSPALRNMEKKGLLAKTKKVWVPETVDETGYDLLDWGEEDEEIVKAMERGETFEEGGEESKEDGRKTSRVEEIRRPHSTPPTPGYGHVVDMVVMPRLPAELP